MAGDSHSWKRVVGLQSKAGGAESRFATYFEAITYVEAITQVLGHADRAAPFRSYCAGLLLPGDRKSVEPMAARVHPGLVRAAHHSLHHLVAKADWSDEAVLAAVRAGVLPVMQQRGPIRALIIGDTAIPKKGAHSVGVARQCCGQLGKQDNCQVAVSLSAAGDHDWSWPTQATATTPTFAMASPKSACLMPLASSPPPSCGRPATSRCRPDNGAGGVVQQRRSVVTPRISRSRPSSWLWLYPRKPGGEYTGAKGPSGA